MARRSGESVEALRVRTALENVLVQLDPSWIILADLRINGPEDPTAADYLMLHSRFGIALIDIILARMGDPAERLRECLVEQGFFQQFPGTFPIVRLVLHPDAAASFSQDLHAAFEGLPPVTIADPNWVPAISNLLAPTAASGIIPTVKRQRSPAPPTNTPRQNSLRRGDESMDGEIAPAPPPEEQPGSPVGLGEDHATGYAEVSDGTPPASEPATLHQNASHENADHAAAEAESAAPEAAGGVDYASSGKARSASPATVAPAWWRAPIAATVLLIGTIGGGVGWFTLGQTPDERLSRSSSDSIANTDPDFSVAAEENVAPEESLIPGESVGRGVKSASTKRLPGADNVRIETGIHDGFGRIVFAWPEMVDYQTYLDDKSLTVEFTRPLTADLAPIARQLPLYAKSATMNGEYAVVIMLKRALGVQSFHNKNRVAIDLLDQPMATAAALSSPPPVAAKPPPATSEADPNPSVSVRLVVEDGVRRIEFGWPKPVDFSASVKNGQAKIRFKRLGTIDGARLAAAVPDLAPHVGGGDREVWVVFKLPTDSRLTAHRKGNLVSVDVTSGKQATFKPLAGSRRPVPVPKPRPPASVEPPQTDEPEAAPEIVPFEPPNGGGDVIPSSIRSTRPPAGGR
jgi:hypothetical protein